MVAKKPDEPTIMHITNIDPGQLLLWSAHNAEHITPALQNEIAAFMQVWRHPQITIKPVKVEL